MDAKLQLAIGMNGFAQIKEFKDYLLTPEPSTLWLLGPTLVGLGAIRYRRRGIRG